MSEIRDYVKSLPVGVKWLGYALLAIFLSGMILAALIFFLTIICAQMYTRPWCWSNDCIKSFFGETDQSFLIAKSTIDLCVAAATVGGIFVALLSYITSSKNGALTNHIEHLKVFCDYLASEINKRDRLTPELIDSLVLYEFIFDQSRSGRTTVSKSFIEFVKTTNTIIEESNSKCQKGVVGGFSYNEHQKKMKQHFAEAGVTLYMAPRNDYFETEGQLFSLLDRISQSFCAPNTVPKLTLRSYH